MASVELVIRFNWIYFCLGEFSVSRPAGSLFITFIVVNVFHVKEHLCLQDIIKCETIEDLSCALVPFRWLKRSVSKIWMCSGLTAPDLQIWTGINHQSHPDAACWTGSSGGMWVLQAALTEKQNRMNDVKKTTTSHCRVFHSFSSAAPGGAYFPQPCTVFQRELCGLHVQLCPLAAQLSSTTWEPRARVHTTHLYTQRERALRGFPAADWFRGLSSSRDSLSRSLNAHPMGGGGWGGSVDQALRSWPFLGWSLWQRHFLFFFFDIF